jgi:hypothetical protein
VGWGHSSIGQAVALARVAGVRHLIGFHHDPGHGDACLDDLYAALVPADTGLLITPAREGARLVVGAQAPT